MLGVALGLIGRHADALLPMQNATALLPNDAEANTNLGIIFLELGRLDEAEASCRRALQIQSDFPEAYNVLGNTLMALGRLVEAKASYRQALQLHPDWADVQSNLGNALQNLGRLNEAADCYRHALQIRPDCAEAFNGLGGTLHKLGQLEGAEASYRRALQFNPNWSEVYSNLSNTLLELGRLEEAEASCRHALRIKPDVEGAHYNLGKILQELNRLDEAEASYRRALQFNPEYADALNNLGTVQQGLGQIEDAVASYRRAIEIIPSLTDAYCNLAGALMNQGKAGEAENFLNKAIELAPGKSKPLATALMYIPYRLDDPRFKQLEAVYAERGTLPMEERIKLNFSMGKAMENIGEFDRAFNAYEEGNRLRYQSHPFDDVWHERSLQELCSIFTQDLFNKFAAISKNLPAIRDKRIPVFIVGMPRSGTTLIEQILASHPAIFGAGELTILGELANKIKPLLLARTNPTDTLLALRKLGQEYLDRVWKFAPDARYITDKLPGNYFHLGLISLMLPNAKIIHSMRDPMDTCFSCYTLFFALGHEYSYDQKMLGRQYLRYRKLMEHWHTVLPPGRILDAVYEDMVANAEREAKRILKYLGLPWNPDCLKFHEHKRVVHTASVTQVRKPIYSSSVARWKHFEKHLEPLLGTMQALVREPQAKAQSAGVAFGAESAPVHAMQRQTNQRVTFNRLFPRGESRRYQGYFAVLLLVVGAGFLMNPGSSFIFSKPDPAPAPVKAGADATAPASVAAKSPAPDMRTDINQLALAANRKQLAEVRIRQSVMQWADAWSRRDVAGYLSFYADDFQLPEGMQRADWQAQRQSRLKKYPSIEVTLNNMEISYPGENTASVRFTQNFRTDTIREIGTPKELRLKNIHDRWLIVSEKSL